MRYTLRQLEVFSAVARSESVSRAAEQLAMSQSAASGALADLEQQFDVLLFDRVGKRLQLNELGRALRPRAEALLEQARELESSLEGRAGAARLRVGATLTIGNYLGVHLVARFLREHPDAQVKLEVANTMEVARKVENFEIDVGLVEGELGRAELDVTPWRDDELVVFSSPTHALSRKRRLSDDDLKRATWIVREPGSGTRQAFERALHGILPELRLGLELEHTEAIKRAVEAGLGLGCLSRITLEDDLSRGNLKALSVPHRDFRRKFFFVLHKRKYRTTGIDEWLKLCRSERG